MACMQVWPNTKLCGFKKKLEFTRIFSVKISLSVDAQKHYFKVLATICLKKKPWTDQ